jgi:DNA-binding MarR family transcriptional regulator
MFDVGHADVNVSKGAVPFLPNLHPCERLAKVKNNAHVPPRPRGVPADPRHDTAHGLHTAAVRLIRRARTADVQIDLDGPRASVLSVLVSNGPVPIGRLAVLEQVSPPAITKTVSALEADGLAERTRSDSDRRVVMVRATPRGRAVLERGRAARIRLVAQLLDGLSDRDRQALDKAAEIIGRIV